MKALAFLWGFAEATVFFIVPDVLLTFLALRGMRRALVASLVALAGALLGGAAMYFWGGSSPEDARAVLVHVPGIHEPLVEAVRSRLDAQGLGAVLLGPLLGTPYKIYAVEWAARGGSMLGFLLISIPARYVRFLLSVLVIGALRKWVRPMHLALAWLAFYVFYFWRFGW